MTPQSSSNINKRKLCYLYNTKVLKYQCYCRVQKSYKVNKNCKISNTCTQNHNNVSTTMPKNIIPDSPEKEDVLTFKNCASYIQDGRTATLQMQHFIYFFSTNIHTEYFKHAAHSTFFSSKCRLFRNATFFGSCVIHILHTGCAKI